MNSNKINYLVTIFFRGKQINIKMFVESKSIIYDKIFTDYPKAKIIKIEEDKNIILNKLKIFFIDLLENLDFQTLDIEIKIAFFEQLAVMLNAGVPILKSIKEINKSIENKKLNKVLNSVLTDINNGQSLSLAFGNFENIFGQLSISMIKLGDKTGDIAQALFRLVNMLEEIRDNKIKFKKAIAYPRNVFIALSFAFIVLINYVVPKFKVIFDRFESELPPITQFLLSLESILNKYGLYIALSFILILGLILFLKKKNRYFKFLLDTILLKTYLIKNIILYSTLHRFTSIFAELLNSGISIYNSLEIAISMVENESIREKLQISYLEINRGKSLYESFEESKIFENMVIQMIATGENSGELQEMLNNISRYYKRKFNNIIESLERSIEPIVLFFVGTLVIILALGIFLPIWDLGRVVIRGQ